MTTGGAACGVELFSKEGAKGTDTLSEWVTEISSEDRWIRAEGGVVVGEEGSG